MRIVSWNIERGGEDFGWKPPQLHEGRRHARVIEALNDKGAKPDVVVLTEFRTRHWDRFRSMFAEADWTEAITSDPTEEQNGVCILARVPIRKSTRQAPQVPHPERWLEVDVPDFDVTVVGIYGPLKAQQYRPFWQSVVPALDERLGARTVVAGDLNTGESGEDTFKEKFFCSRYFMDLRRRGWTDAWRSGREGVRESSYYHHRRTDREDRGFRLDHALLSPVLAAERYHCWYSHTERLRKVSDHSMLLLDLGTPRRQAGPSGGAQAHGPG
jgi:exodeoxyribonuclease III